MDLNFFKEEIHALTKEQQNIIINLLTNLPDYFWTIPASSTGKYHPSFSLGEGGLIRHTKAACAVLCWFYNHNTQSSTPITQLECQRCLMALMLHDGYKLGNSKSHHTAFDHPVIAANIVTQAGYPEIGELIGSHMGQWNTSKYSNVVLPRPQTRLQKLVHFCDYMSSRKWMQADILSYTEGITTNYLDLCMKKYNYNIDDLVAHEEEFNIKG